MIEMNLRMARELVEAFGGDEDAVMALMTGDENGHSGPGVYVGAADYPEEGSNYLGTVEDTRIKKPKMNPTGEARFKLLNALD